MDPFTIRTEAAPLTVRELWRDVLQRNARQPRPYLSWIALVCSVLLTWLAWNVFARGLAGRRREQFVCLGARQGAQGEVRFPFRMEADA